MNDERIMAIREKVFVEFAVAEDNFESAVLLYESERYRTCIPLFRDSVLSGIKSLLMFHLDDLPDDSLLVNSYYQTETSKEIKLDIGLNEILKKLNKAEQESIDHPLTIGKESIKDLDICHKQIENFLAKASKLIKKSLLTTQEFKKKKFVRKLTITIFAVIAVALVLGTGIHFIQTREYGLTGTYFADQNFEKLIETRRDKKIDFDWGGGSIIDDYFDNVYIRWNGKIKAARKGEYRFITISDDGVRLWIDDKLIIDDWKQHAPEDRRAKINLEKGYHSIKVEYFEAGLGACIKLMWIIPGKNREKVISSSYLRKAQ